MTENQTALDELMMTFFVRSFAYMQFYSYFCKQRIENVRMKKRTILQALAIALLVLFIGGVNVVSLTIVLVGEFLLAVYAYKQKVKQEDRAEEPLAPALELLDLHGDPDDISLLDAVRGNELDHQILVYQEQRCFVIEGRPLRWQDIRSVTFNNKATPYEIPSYQVVITTTLRDHPFIHLSVGQDINWARDIVMEMEKWLVGEEKDKR